MLRLVVGRVTTGLGVIRDGLLIVVERGIRRLALGVDAPARDGWKPTLAKDDVALLVLEVATEGDLRSGEARSGDRRSGDSSFLVV